MEDVPDLTTGDKCSSMIRLYVYADTQSVEEVAELMGGPSRLVSPGKHDYKWAWIGNCGLHSNTGDTLREFVGTYLREWQRGLDAVTARGGNVLLYLDIGIADAYRSRVWPDIYLDPASLQALGDHKIELGICLADQMS